MESALVLLLLIVTWRAWLALEERQTPDLGDCWRLGACCALLFLARLEGSFALVAALTLGARRFRRGAGSARLLAALLLPFALAAGSYLLWNKHRFGLWLPISGMIKTRWFATLDLHQRLVGFFDIPWLGRHVLERIYGAPMPPAGARLLCGAIFLSLVALAWSRRTRLAPLLRGTGTTFLVLCCGGIMATDQLLVGPFLAEWATVPIHVLTVLAFGLALDRMSVPRRAALVAVVVLCLLKIPVQAGRANEWESTFTGRSVRLAEWISANVPADDRIGSLFSGALAYFGHRSVVSLDGLVNDADFYREVLIGGHWDAYLQETDITWLTDVGCVDDAPLATLSTAARGGFRSARCYTPVFRIEGAPGGRDCALILWRRVEEGCP
jgi:hypothetical protein